MTFKIVFRKYIFGVLVFLVPLTNAKAQLAEPDSIRGQVDVRDVVRKMRNKPPAPPDTTQRQSFFSVLPSAGYNPSVGFQLGVSSVGGCYFGDPATTTYSTFHWNAYASTNKLASCEFSHNTFTPNNVLNLQGKVEIGRTVAFDYGVGTGKKHQGDGEFSLNGVPLANNSDVFPINFTYIKFDEHIYRKLFTHVYAGAGVVADWYTGIDNIHNESHNFRSHNFRYSMIKGYNPRGYMASGMLFNLQFNSRDQPNRPYKGVYADFVLRVNQQWLGSTKNAVQLKAEARKYVSLSKENPQHVLAFWLWGNYLLGGSIPYLELPGTGSDVANRIGRGYTIGRFKGFSFAYAETEYRFPITSNKLISGVLFANAQTANNRRNIKLYEYWEPGGGAGLRFLFNKYSRSAVCLDYGVGHYGSKGIFLGLNEVF
ncbi:outer membrane protein assembly factor [Mucilaginibacter sp. RS28]|uniref:Outer membrane protein assembly factor n=1 Tax=Mucilaginibacter straminoryzae TaxID=2932774 RepID=A0A9X1X2K9_9SPHI|nr:BamA/TamA family outer membrane protein [Mucilaginibacter straminoryzae]MCJ8209979.1 outer membrane protein assembly factor [Mucilaginibacter straminoryzae]